MNLEVEPRLSRPLPRDVPPEVSNGRTLRGLKLSAQRSTGVATARPAHLLSRKGVPSIHHPAFGRLLTAAVMIASKTPPVERRLRRADSAGLAEPLNCQKAYKNILAPSGSIGQVVSLHECSKRYRHFALRPRGSCRAVHLRCLGDAAEDRLPRTYRVDTSKRDGALGTN